MFFVKSNAFVHEGIHLNSGVPRSAGRYLTLSGSHFDSLSVPRSILRALKVSKMPATKKKIDPINTVVGTATVSSVSNTVDGMTRGSSSKKALITRSIEPIRKMIATR